MKILKRVLFVSFLGCLALAMTAGQSNASEGRYDRKTKKEKKMSGSNIDCQSMKERRMKVFERRDLDEDGYLSESEFRDARKKVKEIDDIEKKEVELEDEDKGYFERQKERRADKRSRRFSRADLNNDGMISKEEFMGRGAYERHCSDTMDGYESEMNDQEDSMRQKKDRKSKEMEEEMEEDMDEMENERTKGEKPRRGRY